MPPHSETVHHNLLRNCSDVIPVDEKRVKCVLIGDGAIGKTSLVVSYTLNGYPTEYVPTAFDNYSVVVKVDNQPVRLNLCDTAGQDDFDSLRPLCYPSTDVFLLCFSVVCPTSFHNVTDKWLPEIRNHCPRTPIVLVGTQSDLRNDVQVLIELSKYRETPVSEKDAVDLTEEYGILGYVECSALTQKNMKEVFDSAIVAAIKIGQTPPLDRKKSFRKSKRKQKSIPNNASKTTNNSSKKQGGWKKLCCFL